MVNINRSLLLKVTLISFIFLSFVFIYLVLFQKKEISNTSSLQEINRQYPIIITGINSTTYNKNRLLANLRADEFKVNPRRFLFFNIKPFNEFTLTNVRLRYHLYEDIPTQAGLFNFGESLLSLTKDKTNSNSMGLITRGVIKGLILEIYKKKQLSLVIKAQKAYIDINKKKINLIGTDIEDVLSKKYIKSKAVVWDDKDKIFKIPGNYIATTPKGKAKGKGIKIDLDFVVTPFD